MTRIQKNANKRTKWKNKDAIKIFKTNIDKTTNTTEDKRKQLQQHNIKQKKNRRNQLHNKKHKKNKNKIKTTAKNETEKTSTENKKNNNE